MAMESSIAILLTAVSFGVTNAEDPASLPADPPPASNAATVENVDPVWKENFTVEYPGTLPVSVAFSADGRMLLTGDTSGEVTALIFPNRGPLRRWQSGVGGSHTAVALSADQQNVYATTRHGVRILDVVWGKEEARIEVEASNPTAIGVFPNKTIAKNFSRLQIVFGNSRGYFVKSWAQGELPGTIGTIETATVAKDAKPADEAAVPLAVDPNGRSAIMTGPRDATGKNVLWAYVCGDYDEGSPGNRVMAGHTSTVVSAAWAREGGTAVTGDAVGRVIMWDAKTMKETGHLELGGRIASLAISDDGTRTAAYVIGKHAEVFVWETANLKKAQKPIHTELGDFSGAAVYASLSFSPNGRQLAGCAVNKKWLTRLGELVGKVRGWKLYGSVTLGNLVHVGMLGAGVAQHPLVCGRAGTDFPTGRETIFRSNESDEEIHAVFPAGVTPPDKLDGKFVLHGRLQGIQNWDRYTHKKPPKDYQYLVVSSWEHDR